MLARAKEARIITSTFGTENRPLVLVDHCPDRLVGRNVGACSVRESIYRAAQVGQNYCLHAPFRVVIGAEGSMNSLHYVLRTTLYNILELCTSMYNVLTTGHVREQLVSFSLRVVTTVVCASVYVCYIDRTSVLRFVIVHNVLCMARVLCSEISRSLDFSSSPLHFSMPL